MKKMFCFTLCWFLLCLNSIAFAQHLPRLFLFIGGDTVSSHAKALENPCVYGVQVIYSWKQLEPQKGIYDFSKIEKDLLYLNKLHKKLFIQLQDRSFEPTRFNVPDYIRTDKEYHGGVAPQYDFPGEGKPITLGWVARVWDKTVRERFQLLMQQLAIQFDGKITGINLPETAVAFDEHNLPSGFTFDNYFYAELENIRALRNAFHNSIVMQYVNFFPGEWNNDHHYMSKIFSFAKIHQISLGGPDTIPYRIAQMQNSYPFFHVYKGKFLTGIAIQEPDYTYKNPETKNYYTFEDFYHFTQDFLGATILFWNTEEPFFSTQLVTKLNSNYFSCVK